jgi:hypothetical protein
MHMASGHRQPGRPFWLAAFTLSDGRRVFRSTKTRDKRQASEIARTWQKAARVGRQGKLTPDAARAIISAGASDVFAVASGERLPGTTVGEWCIQWLAIKKVETEVSTHQRYGAIVKRFVDGLGVRSKSDLSAVRSEDIASLRDRLGGRRWP